MKQKNYYEILGLPESASDADIKKAFRTLAKQCHPDHHPGDAKAEARFKDISEAYEVLGDKEKRRKYDELRRYSAGEAQEGMSYEDFLRKFGGERSRDNREFTWGFGGDSLDDIFSSLFGGGRSRPQQRPRSTRGTRATSPQTNTSSEASSRKAAQQEPQPTSDPFFKRKGNDAYVDIPLNLAQALLGSKIRVRTPGGNSVHVKIPPGIAAEGLLRVRGMGYTERGGTGDLYIRTHLTLPSALSDEQRQAAEHLAELLNMKH